MAEKTEVPVEVTDGAVEAARKSLQRRKWSVPKANETAIRHIREAVQAAVNHMRDHGDG